MLTGLSTMTDFPTVIARSRAPTPVCGLGGAWPQQTGSTPARMVAVQKKRTSISVIPFLICFLVFFGRKFGLDSPGPVNHFDGYGYNDLLRFHRLWCFDNFLDWFHDRRGGAPRCRRFRRTDRCRES